MVKLEELRNRFSPNKHYIAIGLLLVTVVPLFSDPVCQMKYFICHIKICNIVIHIPNKNYKKQIDKPGSKCLKVALKNCLGVVFLQFLFRGVIVYTVA